MVVVVFIHLRVVLLGQQLCLKPADRISFSLSPGRGRLSVAVHI